MPLFGTCPVNFFIEKLYLHGTTTQTCHSTIFSCLKKQEETLSQLVQLRFSFTHWQNKLVGDILILDKLTMFQCLKFELGKFWNKLKRYAKILLNQPHVSIFLGSVHLHRTVNQLFMALPTLFIISHFRLGQQTFLYIQKRYMLAFSLAS